MKKIANSFSSEITFVLHDVKFCRLPTRKLITINHGPLDQSCDWTTGGHSPSPVCTRACMYVSNNATKLMYVTYKDRGYCRRWMMPHLDLEGPLILFGFVLRVRIQILPATFVGPVISSPQRTFTCQINSFYLKKVRYNLRQTSNKSTRLSLLSYYHYLNGMEYETPLIRDNSYLFIFPHTAYLFASAGITL